MLVAIIIHPKLATVAEKQAIELHAANATSTAAHWLELYNEAASASQALTEEPIDYSEHGRKP